MRLKKCIHLRCLVQWYKVGFDDGYLQMPLLVFALLTVVVVVVVVVVVYLLGSFVSLFCPFHCCQA